MHVPDLVIYAMAYKMEGPVVEKTSLVRYSYYIF